MAGRLLRQANLLFKPHPGLRFRKHLVMRHLFFMLQKDAFIFWIVYFLLVIFSCKVFDNFQVLPECDEYKVPFIPLTFLRKTSLTNSGVL